MKPSIKIVACMVFLIALLPESCKSPKTTQNESVDSDISNLIDNKSIRTVSELRSHPSPAMNGLVGVWKVSEVTITGPDAEIITNPQPSICIFTKKYMSLVGVRGKDPRPELPENPNIDQLAIAWQSLAASVSTYEVEGNTITIHPIVSKSPNIKPGDFNTLEYRFEEDNLLVTPKTDQDGPIEDPFTLEFTRVE